LWRERGGFSGSIDAVLVGLGIERDSLGGLKE